MMPRSFYKTFVLSGGHSVRVTRDALDSTYGVYRSYVDGGQLIGIISKETPIRWVVTGYPMDPQRTLSGAVVFLAERVI
jgi:hypothetical protein